ncbi:hypothetical protein [Gracilimonas sp.]|uniref:hypothetical protein n=1 Tax=Gracilimonas sp. TaxID=1974203 RepID=UPI0028715D14|nr:hypothetical protein [Gracilimonas sp.]
MKFFRTHIIQSFNIGFLLIGMVFYFLKPTNAHSDHDAFASWLQSNLKANSNGEIADQIQQLVTSKSEIESVIREASTLVKAHAENFELPLSEQSQDENDVFKLLLKEWEDYQNSSSGMGKAVIVKQANPHSILPLDGFSFGGKFIGQHSNLFLTSANNSFQQSSIYLFNESASPLKSGIAINAP